MTLRGFVQGLGSVALLAWPAGARGTRAEDTAASRQLAALVEMTAAVNAGDAARYARLYAEDAVITIAGSSRLDGRAAIEQHEVELLRQFPGARLGFHDVWQKGALAVVHYAVAGEAAGGRAMGHEGLLFYRFRPSGLIEEERRYLDSLTPMAQLGALGDAAARPLPQVPAAPGNHVAAGSAAEDANVALVKRVLAAADSADRAAFLSRVADDATIDELVLPRPFTGPRGAAAWLEAWTAAVRDARTEVTSALAVGEFVLLETVLRGTLHGSLGPVSAADAPFAVGRAAVFQVRGGKVVRVSAFLNGRELAQAVGRWPPAPGPSRP